MSWMTPRRARAKEALADSLAASGAYSSGYDPIDGDTGFRQYGASRREVPAFTRTKARALSVHAYRINPMAKAIVDTYTSFCVGDSGVSVTCSNDDVRKVVDDFWDDPRNALSNQQELLLRSHMLEGETALEMMVGERSGVTRFSYIEPEGIADVRLLHGNPLWPAALQFKADRGASELAIVQVDDITGLRTGQAMFWPEWRAVATDRRGFPFLSPVLDWLDAYDQVIWNLIDRTAIARHIVFDVTVEGDVDEFVAKRGGLHAPRAGTVEVHNKGVEWKIQSPQVGAYEDKQTGQLAMTNLAAGAGLAKTWLAEPEDANRATSLTMAEPVRRRVGGVQNLWLQHQTDMVRFAVDQAVARGRLPAEVDVTDSNTGDKVKIPAAMAVSVVGPEIAAADAKVNAEILVQLSQALTGLQAMGALSKPAAQTAAKKAWESFMGVPYDHTLDERKDPDELTDYLDSEQEPGGAVNRLVAA